MKTSVEIRTKMHGLAIKCTISFFNTILQTNISTIYSLSEFLSIQRVFYPYLSFIIFFAKRIVFILKFAAICKTSCL